MTPPRTVPTIPGWDVYDDEGTLVAVRQAPLTEYQRLYGAMGEVHARDEGELRVICTAQYELAQRLAQAEFSAPKIRRFHAAPDPAMGAEDARVAASAGAEVLGVLGSQDPPARM
ncbi:MAG: hypothetical protein JWN52_7209 [Actinomycetia bacterium]|nr:hypothetical protein [Actinomycetes bacterium]